MSLRAVFGLLIDWMDASPDGWLGDELTVRSPNSWMTWTDVLRRWLSDWLASC